MSKSPDADILAFAERTERVIFTADLDFPRLFAQLGQSSPGLILLRNGNYSEAESLNCLRRVLMAVPESELIGGVFVVDENTIRRRRLPL